MMFKFKLVLVLLFVNIGAYAADYYVKSNSSFPEPQLITKVYMGDKMLDQKYVYSEQCYTPKKSFTLSKLIEEQLEREAVCLSSSKRIEKTCCFDGIRQITDGGIMCSTDEENFYARNFYSFQREDGSEKSKNDWFTFKRKKGKVTIYQQPAKAKMIKMTDAEFEETFTRTELWDQPWNASLVFEEDVSFCKAYSNRDSGIFNGVNSSLIKTLPAKTLTGRVSSVSVSPSENSVNITANHSQGSSTWNLPDEEFRDSFEETSKVIEVKASLQRTIEYAGINGNLVKFIYSEFNNGMARDAFTREFSIDLSADNVAAYKGAVFEVIKATNSTIEYKVIRNFPVET